MIQSQMRAVQSWDYEPYRGLIQLTQLGLRGLLSVKSMLLLLLPDLPSLTQPIQSLSRDIWIYRSTKCASLRLTVSVTVSPCRLELGERRQLSR